MQELLERLLSGRPTVGELRLRANGTLREIEYRATPDVGPGIHLLVLRDTTDRNRVAEALAAEVTWLRSFIERSPVAMLLIDSDGRLHANQAALERFGELPSRLAPATAVEQHILQPNGCPFPAGAEPLERAMAGESTRALEVLLDTPRGRFPALLTAGPIFDLHGERIGAMAVFEDLSAFKELERTREEWTSVVAHDLRQPVTVIQAQAQLLARRIADHPDPKVHAKLGHILAASRQLDRMIGDLLDVSRIESRRLVLELRPTKLPELVADVVERHAEDLVDREVRVVAPADLPEVLADPVRVEQVLANLLSNATKYGRAGTPIEIALSRRGNQVAVAVTNEGRGIRPEEMAGLFSRFYRARSAVERKIAGLGLGLYITRGLVEAHGGTISAESEPDKTTTFTFTLPIA